MLRLLRGRLILPLIRNQTADKNIPGLKMPVEHRGEDKRTGFNPGDKAPFAYNDVLKYPSDYQPWTPNYKGNGLFYAFLALSFFALAAYETTYLRRTGQKERDHRKKYYKP